MVDQVGGGTANPATDTTLESVLAREIATWTAGTLPTEQQTPIGLEDTGGVQVDPATEVTLAAIAGALASNATDTLQTEQQSPVGIEDTTGTQVGPATDATLTNTLAREIATWTAGTLPTEQQTPIGLEDTGGVQVDPSTEATLAAIAGALASNATDTLQTEQQTPVGVEDSAGTQVDPRTEDFVHRQASGLLIDVSVSTEVTENLEGAVPGRADEFVIDVEFGAAGHVEVRTTDGAGTVITTIDDNDIAALGVAGAGHVFETVDVAAPDVIIAFVDDSGADQNIDYNIYAR